MDIVFKPIFGIVTVVISLILFTKRDILETQIILNMNSDIGAKIALVLKQKGIGLENLAERVNMRHEQLEMILNNQFTPSLIHLKRISIALEVPINILMDGTEDAPIAISRAASLQESISFSASVEDQEGAYKFFSLAAGKVSRSMEPFILTLQKGDSDVISRSSHEGEEFIYVTQGSIELSYGDTTHTLGCGDSIYIDSIVPHSFKGIEEKNSLLIVVNYPS